MDGTRKHSHDADRSNPDEIRPAIWLFCLAILSSCGFLIFSERDSQTSPAVQHNVQAVQAQNAADESSQLDAVRRMFKSRTAHSSWNPEADADFSQIRSIINDRQNWIDRPTWRVARP